MKCISSLRPFSGLQGGFRSLWQISIASNIPSFTRPRTGSWFAGMQRSLPRAWLARVKSYNLQIVSQCWLFQNIAKYSHTFLRSCHDLAENTLKADIPISARDSKQGRSEYRSNMFGEATRNNLPLSQNEPVPIGDIALAATFASWNSKMLCMMFQYVSAL